MPSTTGTVTRIYTDETFGCVILQPTGAPTVTYILWAFTSQTDDSDRRFQNSYYLSLARDAMTTGRKLEVNFNTGSSFATGVALVP